MWDKNVQNWKELIPDTNVIAIKIMAARFMVYIIGDSLTPIGDMVNRKPKASGILKYDHFIDKKVDPSVNLFTFLPWKNQPFS